MVNPQKENGHMGIANELVEAFQLLHLSGNQWRLLWTILRFTYGWNKKVDCISLTTFEKGTGLNRWNLKRDLNDLFHRGIIIKDSSDYITKYGLQKDHTKWQTSIKNNTSIKNDTAASIKNDTKTSIKNNTHKRQKTIKDTYKGRDFKKPTIPDWIPKKEWADFLEMRKEIKSPMTNNAIKLAINKLEKLKQEGYEPKDVLNESILNNWKGLFAIKNYQSEKRYDD